MISDTEITGLREAYRAALRSPDPSNQNGAVLLSPSGRLVGIRGWNDIDPAYKGTVDLHDRDEKLFYIQHAERAVILRACRLGLSTRYRTLVCPWFACSDCAKAISWAKITRVVGHKQRMDLTPDRWKANVAKANQYLRDCGIELEFYDGELGCAPIRCNGTLWTP